MALAATASITLPLRDKHVNVGLLTVACASTYKKTYDEKQLITQDQCKLRTEEKVEKAETARTHIKMYKVYNKKNQWRKISAG